MKTELLLIGLNVFVEKIRKAIKSYEAKIFFHDYKFIDEWFLLMLVNCKIRSCSFVTFMNLQENIRDYLRYFIFMVLILI